LAIELQSLLERPTRIKVADASSHFQQIWRGHVKPPCHERQIRDTVFLGILTFFPAKELAPVSIWACPEHSPLQTAKGEAALPKERGSAGRDHRLDNRCK
jgi:hypothetical protein